MMRRKFGNGLRWLAGRIDPPPWRVKNIKLNVDEKGLFFEPVSADLFKRRRMP